MPKTPKVKVLWYECSKSDPTDNMHIWKLFGRTGLMEKVGQDVQHVVITVGRLQSAPD